MTSTITRLTGSLRRLPVRWTAAVLIALALAYADSFWLTVIQLTIGAIERTESPFIRWLRDGALLLPVMFLVALLALGWAHRWQDRDARAPLGHVLAALLVALATAGIGVLAVGANSAYDYSFQRQHLELMHSFGANQLNAGEIAGFTPAAQLSYQLYCNLRGVAAGNAVSLLEYATLMTHVRALAYASVLILATNLGIAAVLVALLRGRLWSPRVAAVAWRDETSRQPAAAGALLRRAS